MITKELIDKINYLARKQRTQGLTPEEKAEQDQVRRIYLDNIKAQVRQTLEVAKPEKDQHDHDCSCGCHHDH